MKLTEKDIELGHALAIELRISVGAAMDYVRHHLRDEEQQPKDE